MIANGSSEIKYISTNKPAANPDRHTPEVQEILDQMPLWTIRLGLAIICVIIISVIAFSFLVRYPDSISSRFIITNLNSRPGQVYGQLMMPASQAGKVTIGQKANIRFDNHPAAKYGIVRGKVIGVSPKPETNNYVVSIELENQSSPYHKKIIFKEAMRGNAEVIISGPRIIDRIRPLKALADKISF